MTPTPTLLQSSVRDEYTEREYLPGVKWVNVAARPGTSLYTNNAGGHRDELHVLVIDVDNKILVLFGSWAFHWSF